MKQIIVNATPLHISTIAFSCMMCTHSATSLTRLILYGITPLLTEAATTGITAQQQQQQQLQQQQHHHHHHHHHPTPWPSTCRTLTMTEETKDKWALHVAKIAFKDKKGNKDDDNDDNDDKKADMWSRQGETNKEGEVDDDEDVLGISTNSYASMLFTLWVSSIITYDTLQPSQVLEVMIEYGVKVAREGRESQGYHASDLLSRMLSVIISSSNSNNSRQSTSLSTLMSHHYTIPADVITKISSLPREVRGHEYLVILIKQLIRSGLVYDIPDSDNDAEYDGKGEEKSEEKKKETKGNVVKLSSLLLNASDEKLMNKDVSESLHLTVLSNLNDWLERVGLFVNTHPNLLLIVLDTVMDTYEHYYCNVSEKIKDEYYHSTLVVGSPVPCLFNAMLLGTTDMRTAASQSVWESVLKWIDTLTPPTANNNTHSNKVSSNNSNNSNTNTSSNNAFMSLQNGLSTMTTHRLSKEETATIATDIFNRNDTIWQMLGSKGLKVNYR